MLDFAQLRTAESLATLDQKFLHYLREHHSSAAGRLEQLRGAKTAFSRLELSQLILDTAPHLERFLATALEINSSLNTLNKNTLRESRVGLFKQEFVLKRTRRYRGDDSMSFIELQDWLDAQISASPYSDFDREAAISCLATDWLEDETKHSDDIDKITLWCKRAREENAGQQITQYWDSFRIPQTVDPAHLVTLESILDDNNTRMQIDPKNFRQRDGFSLTDKRMSARAVQAEINYCVYCHDHEGDFCSTGFPENKKKPELGLKVNALGVTLTGCPLEEKISEMHLLKRNGNALAALAVAMIDNPMIPATGHRICNDCMKACIYQKKDPVNIPQIETRVLTDVLNLPWGVEIYDLLTRWNPLRAKQFVMKPFNGRKVLISGMGPAGFTMAHHLTMEGCIVTGIEGLKIEPLPQALLNHSIQYYDSIKQNLDERILAGFGGVAEYGITVRWDKNFLSLIYLTLARRQTFQAFGGIRLGGTLTLDDAWRLGFDHVCIANGAGLPRVIPVGNSLARGMRQANDFLMALQLTGAAKDDSLANLQVRLPAAVIGGGLTAIDTATEIQAYYIKQVEKTLRRYEILCADIGETAIRQRLDVENLQILDEFLHHGRAVKAERQRATLNDAAPDFIALLRKWGGVTIVYRKGLNESPAYQRNHEEVLKAMEEGIYYSPGLDPQRCELDEFNHVEALVCRRLKLEDGRWLATNEEVHIPAKAVMVAAGTFPNTIYETEHPGSLQMEHDHFLPHVSHSQSVQPVGVAEHCKSPEFGAFTSYNQDNKRVSFIGDTHPVFNGSVVKAIASASRSYEGITATLEHSPPPVNGDKEIAKFNQTIAQSLNAEVVSINTDHPGVIELWVRAPMMAKNFQPGQFFRLQMFETLSQRLAGTRLQIPLQTVSGAGIQGDNVRLLLLRWGANAKLAARLTPGQRLVLMGPTGAPTPVPQNKTIMVVAGSWGAAVMIALGPALRAAGNRVLYFAAYNNQQELYYQEELQASADNIVWSVAEGEKIVSKRPQDASIVGGDVVSNINRYAKFDGRIRPTENAIDLQDVDEILVMGGTRLLRSIRDAMRQDLCHHFKTDIEITGTVGSPMQCMLKGVCAQCLQWQIDPDSGERTRAVFACSMQDQPLMWIDLENLDARQSQNRLQEHLTGLWLDYVLKQEPENTGETVNDQVLV